MKQVRKKELLAKLKEEIEKAEQMKVKTKKAARVFKTASRSQQGDKILYENSHHMALDYFHRLLDFEKEVRSVSEKKPEKVEPVSFVRVNYLDGNEVSFYFAEKGTNLADLQVVTPSSPLGKSIAGKKEGSRFSYQIKREDKTVSFSGLIKKIE